MFLRFILPNVEKGRTLSMHLMGSYSLDFITQRTISNSPGYPIVDGAGNLVLENGVPKTLDAVGRYSESINMNGNWSANFGIDYGFPLKFMKSNLNLSAGLSYVEQPSQMGQWTAPPAGTPVPPVVWTSNRSRSISPSAGLTLGSNISERIDFRVSYYLSYSNVSNTFSSASNSDNLQHYLNANAKFVLPLDFTISADMAYTGYNQLSGSSFGASDRNFVIVNAAIGKKVFRSKQGEVSLFVNDIFNQNTSFQRRAESQWVENRLNLVIGRYFGVKFTWNLRFFGKNGSQNPAMYSAPDGDHHGHGHGRGGGGGPGGGGGFWH
jgi:hypothetical protein